MIMGMRYRLLLASLMVLSNAAFGQETAIAPPLKGSTPIEVHASPQSAIPNVSITLSGNVLTDSKTGSVKITITPPNQTSGHPSPTVLAAPPDNYGNFSAIFKDTKASGTYQVEAVSPGGYGNAKTSFTVQQGIAAVQSIISKAIEEENALTDEAKKAVDGLDSDIKALPISPPKNALTLKLSTLMDQLKGASDQTETIQGSLDALSTITEEYPEAEILLAPTLGQLEQWREGADAERIKINGELIDSRKRGARCDALAEGAEVMRYAGELLTLYRKPIEIMDHLALEMAAEKALPETEDPKAKLAISSGVRLAILALHGPVTTPVSSYFKNKQFHFHYHAPGPKDWITTVVQMTLDVTAYIVDKAFDKYCEKFEGPFNATMRAVAVSKLGEPWWKYSVLLSGKLVLRYAKEQTQTDSEGFYIFKKSERPAVAIHVTGEFEGNANKFGVWEDAFHVGYPKLFPRGDPLFHLTIPPMPALGAVPSKVLPQYFRVPVEGEFIKDKINLKLLDAAVDYGEPEARVIYISMGRFTLFLPVIIKFNLPYKDAHFILGRALGNKPAEFSVIIKEQEKLSLIEGDFKDHHGDPGKTGADYDMHVTACNPKCGE